MFKFFRRLLCLAMLLSGVLLYIVTTRGGEPFLHFGTRAEKELSEIGRKLKDYSRKAAEQADQVKEGTDKVRETVQEMKDNAPDIPVPPVSKKDSPPGGDP